MNRPINATNVSALRFASRKQTPSSYYTNARLRARKRCRAKSHTGGVRLTRVLFMSLFYSAPSARFRVYRGKSVAEVISSRRPTPYVRLCKSGRAVYLRRARYGISLNRPLHLEPATRIYLADPRTSCSSKCNLLRRS